MQFLTILAVLLQPAPAAIPAVEIRSDVLCSTCRFVRDTVVILDPDYAVVPNSIVLVGRDVFVTPASDEISVRRFDLSTGRYLGSLSRQGDGPGELRLPAFFARLPGDSLLVFDRGLQRFSVFTPGTYSYVRGATVRVSRVTALVYHSASRAIWMAAPIGSAEQVGYPVHLFADDGQWSRSTGPGQPLLRRDGYMSFARHLAVGPDGNVWAVTRYGTIEIERYDAEGRLTRRFSYAPPWSPGLERLMPQREGQPPLPERPPFALEDRHLIWVATLVPASDWQRGIMLVADPTHGANTPLVGDISKIADSIVELIDVERRAVEVRTRIDEAVVSFLEGGLVVLYRQTEAGEPQLWIEQWRVRGRPSTQRRVP